MNEANNTSIENILSLTGTNIPILNMHTDTHTHTHTCWPDRKRYYYKRSLIESCQRANTRTRAHVVLASKWPIT